MKDEQKKVSQGVAVVDLLHPEGRLCFVKYFAKIACFYSVFLS